jgi:hypothetical protein
MNKPGVAACGADYANMRKTEVITKVNCRECLKVYAASSEKLRVLYLQNLRDTRLENERLLGAIDQADSMINSAWYGSGMSEVAHKQWVEVYAALYAPPQSTAGATPQGDTPKDFTGCNDHACFDVDMAAKLPPQAATGMVSEEVSDGL